nr:monoacylglycerol lipase ABHD6 isoform X1 [Vicugna pacos]XP_015091857.1 monoacylglycerol lipase ABHD6 isoform X1 [Vicugna pacos]XP_031542243.1 monoacylglycerol lipase ABHD6 isoform X1 [Vicugna pacos]XP_031542244.1 monoacylglycerol lipase ABHD6 isoform X1 [Vicugna pacos]
MDLDVVNMFVIAGGTLAIPILAFVASFLLWPSALIRIYYWYWRRALGMQVRYVHHGDYQFCYSFRGRPGHKPSILMLHGFSAHKDMWLSVVKFLPKNLHLVCVDMPGHEGTTRSSLDDLSIDGQVKRIHQFVECLKLNKKPFHLIGTSMGGHVAGVYAAYYPSDVCSLSLVCPAGLQYSTDNQFVQRLKELQESATVEKIPLIPSTPEEMSEMLQLCSYVRFKVPQQILQGLVTSASLITTSTESCFWKSSTRSRDTPSIRTWTRSRFQRRSSGGNKTRCLMCLGQTCWQSQSPTARWNSWKTVGTRW